MALISPNETATGMIGRFTEKALLKRAEEVVTEKSKTSDIFDDEAESLLPRFKRSGGFDRVDASSPVSSPVLICSSLTLTSDPR